MDELELVREMIKMILNIIIGFVAVLALFGIYAHMFRTKKKP